MKSSLRHRSIVAGAGLKAQFRPAKTGAQTLLGQTVDAITPIDAAGGMVFIEGEYWSATSETPVAAGEPVKITGRDGLNLQVKQRPQQNP